MEIEMKSILIADTTREEREQIVAESIGNIDGLCDGCSPGLIEMYQEYIDGRKELKEINPTLYEQLVPMGSATVTTLDTWNLSNMLSRNIENARAAQQAALERSARSAGGFGGHTSIGGGGGFSGGGHGGFR